MTLNKEKEPSKTPIRFNKLSHALRENLNRRKSKKKDVEKNVTIDKSRLP